MYNCICTSQFFVHFGPVHTNAFSKACVFVIIENASIDSRPHYRLDDFLTVHTKTLENDRVAGCDVS